MPFAGSADKEWKKKASQLIQKGIGIMYEEPVGPGWKDPITGYPYEVLEAQYVTLGTMCGGENFWKDIVEYHEKIGRNVDVQKMSPSLSKEESQSHKRVFKSNVFLPKIVGLSGMAGCGKTTMAELAQQEFGYRPLPFASPFKKSLAFLFATEPGNFENQDYKKGMAPVGNSTVREWLQKFGTEGFGRALHEDYWVKLHQWFVEKLARKDPDAKFVVPDNRFENEKSYIRESGGLVIKVVRPGLALDERVSSHVSERGFLDSEVDFVLNNKGTPRDMLDQFVVAIQTFNEKKRVSGATTLGLYKNDSSRSWER